MNTYESYCHRHKAEKCSSFFAVAGDGGKKLVKHKPTNYVVLIIN